MFLRQKISFKAFSEENARTKIEHDMDKYFSTQSIASQAPPPQQRTRSAERLHPVQFHHMRPNTLIYLY